MKTKMFGVVLCCVWASHTGQGTNPWNDIPAAVAVLNSQKKPKSWHEYVKALAFHRIHQTNNSTVHVQALGILFKEARAFSKLTKIERLGGKNSTLATGWLTSIYSKYITCQEDLRIIEHKVGMKIKTFSKIVSGRKSVEFEKIFFLDKHLSLNLTFHVLVFLERNVGVCSSFNIVFFKGREFNLCGKHAVFSIFTPGNQLKIKGSMEQCTFHRIISTFMVTDRGFVETVVDKSEKHVLVDCFILHPKAVLSVFLFQTDKNKMLWVQTSLTAHFLVVYDGPNSLSPKVPESKKSYMLSTFLGKIWILSQSKNYTLNYLSQNQVMTEIVLAKQNTTSFALDECQPVLCITKLTAKPGFRVNVSLLQMSFDGENTVDCLLGGLAIVDLIGTKKKENLVFCLQSAGKNFYSQTSVLVVVLFQYQPVSRMRIRSYVLSTKCTVVHLSLCEVYFWCDHYHWRARCEKLLKLSSNANVELTFSPETHMSVKFSLENDTNRECVVLQCTRDKTMLPGFNKPCTVSIGFHRILKKNLVVQNTITSHAIPFVQNLQKKEVEPCHEAMCNSAYLMHHITLYGSVDYLCSRFGTNESLRCSENPRKFNNLGAIWSYNGSNTNKFSMSSLNKTPMKTNRFIIEIALEIYVHSWIEIISEIVPLNSTPSPTRPNTLGFAEVIWA